MVSEISLFNADCLEIMENVIPDNSVDMILCDLPYGTTQNKWDSIIPLDKLWDCYNRICKGSIVLTATQPFSSLLVSSNLKSFKYEWIWEKSRSVGFLNAKKQPLRKHESILVFGSPKIYNPQGLIPCNKVNKRTTSGSNYNKAGLENIQTETNYPHTVLKISSEGSTLHPTQKPIALMEYLIKTYTNEGMTVLDNCMGSGTTGVACKRLNRNFIGIEKDETYFKIAEKRIMEA